MGIKSLLCSHRCDRDVPVWCGWCSLILAGELQRNGESVAAGVFVDSGFENGVFYGALHKGFVYVPASFLTCQFVLPAVFLRKESLSFEFLLPEGYFESRALGRLTAPNPSSKSFWRIFLTSSICFSGLP